MTELKDKESQLLSTQHHSAILDVMRQLSRIVCGQDEVVRSLITALLCNGSVLLEGPPGTAKTRSVRALGRILQASFGRIQFTPDLLPADITGSEVYHDDHGQARLHFQPGPIFNELVLADEINRAPAKVQSALLEAMEERQVTVAGVTYPLPALFMVLATQNPIDLEGTYPLPEAQLDRFMMKILLHYPGPEVERSIVRMMQTEEEGQLPPARVIPQSMVFGARADIHRIRVSDVVEQYMVDLVMATRHPERFNGAIASWLEAGVSSRATIFLHRAARAGAWLDGRDYVTPEDVRAVVHATFRHRLVISYEALADKVDVDTVIDEILRQVAVG